jgi:hypothetical protein
MIQEAYCKLQVMSEDEANRMIYEARLKARRDEYSRTQGALRKGLTEGREKIARNLKALEVPVSNSESKKPDGADKTGIYSRLFQNPVGADLRPTEQPLGKTGQSPLFP